MSSDSTFCNSRIRRKRDNPGWTHAWQRRKTGAAGNKPNKGEWRSEHRRYETFQWARTGRAARPFFLSLVFSSFFTSEYVYFFLSFVFFLFLFNKRVRERDENVVEEARF